MPYFLRLRAILDNGEVLYQETSLEEIQEITKQEDPVSLVRMNSQLKYSKTLEENQEYKALSREWSNWRFSFHPDSIFSGWFGFSLGTTRHIRFLFKKSFQCTHKFGCWENLFRRIFFSIAVTCLAKSVFSLTTGIDIDDKVGSFISDKLKQTGVSEAVRTTGTPFLVITL